MIRVFHVDVSFIVGIHFTTCLFTFADLLLLFRRFWKCNLLLFMKGLNQRKQQKLKENFNKK
jgi:hypothetical protein